MRTKSGRATKNTGAGTVTDVTGTPTGHVTVATGTTTPKLAVVSAPTAGSTGKLHATPITGNPTAAGEVLVSTAVDAAHWAAGGTGTVTDVTGTLTGHVTVATGTTTPKLAVVSAPTTGKLNTTVVTGNPAAAGDVLKSTGANAADWAAENAGTVTDVTGTLTGHVTVATGTTTPALTVVSAPTTGKLNATAITGNPAAAGKVLLSTAANAADWGTVPAPTLTHVSSFIIAAVTLAAATAKEITSVTLGAGTWLILAQALLHGTASATAYLSLVISTLTASVTTVVGGAQTYPGSTAIQMLNCSAIVTPVATTIYYLNAKTKGGAGVVYPAGFSGTGSFTANVATGLRAIKL